ncbi:L-idonate 5-dehydrogenase (NAD(P)(+)) [Variibacter gotjawalensis]|uniref:L-idonate 5-dehydrogenase (NAD(P)(+)) n=1 Tax=Variibacter gotjawalensis TaxID=1333996 RepID=A0A0S3PQ64_9BRAD|nr:L-idonate 5-dehydrogenase [Variibacter gotjawalensis]NIK48310.1 L-idonate 5-dehydrogenase [Variibacter gotjawalensis]RZS50182.1 L-idonate 5-dehydrogenase [Variibacter gotjawalensis]BAT58012.1 L-idonate 5-dehydrogenase (NAD(P)(+)) [Variibacter gotjawalensis]
MRSIVIHKAKDLRIEEREPEALGADQVEIAMAMGGVCGSDLHYYNHGAIGTIKLREPMILGHEVSGRITKLGANVANLKVGQLVAVSPSRPCGHCQYCAEGLRIHCLNMRFYGSALPFPHVQGAFREVLIADAPQCVPADGLSAGEAAMAEPLAVVLHATRLAGSLVGKRVLVTGSGPIGVLAILSARRAGAAEIVATDLADFPLTLARKVGANHALNMKTQPDALTPYAANKGSFGVLFECSGAAPALAAAVPALRPRAVIVQLGIGGDMTVPMQQITAREIELRGSFRFHEEFAVAVRMMQQGLIDVKPLITHTVPLDRAEDAFRIANDRSQAMKAQIAFNA